MSAQIYSVPDKTEGRSFWNGKAETCPINYFLHVRVMLTIIKMFNILFVLVGIGNILAIFKTNQQALFQLSVQVYSLLGQTKGERKAFILEARL